MENALIQVQEIRPADLFSASSEVEAIIQEIERKALDGYDPDLTTAAGRKRIASQAHKVARSKTLLDDMGKELVAGLKKQVKTVDVERKRLRDGLDDLKARVRKPLTEWEAAEADRIAAEKLAAEIDAAHAQALEENRLFDERREIERQRAEMERQEAERRAREEAERQERERIEREERIAREAAETARREAGEAERKRWEAAERERLRMAEEARREAEERDHAEKKRKAEEARRIADQEHRAKVERGIKAALIGLGCYIDTAEAIIEAVGDGKIPGLLIEY